MSDVRNDLARTTLSVLFIVALLGASLGIVRPFLLPAFWAATLVIATWPLMCRVQRRLWNSRALAVTFMILVLLVVFVVPFWLAISTIVENSGQIVSWVELLAAIDAPTVSSWLVDLPLVGNKLADLWGRFEGAGAHNLLQRALPYAGAVTQWFIAAIGGVGLVLLQFLLTVGIAAIMYANGEVAAAAIIRFAVRLAGSRGEQAVRIAGQAIRGVALGVVVTALIQSAIGGIGLAIAGVPYASVLCAVMFMLCIAQIGPAPVLVPVVIWMFMGEDLGRATLLLVFSILAIGMDNVLRPILIRKGADLPLLLILAGVIGGLMALGLIGIFLGPVILAVGYRLLGAWIAEGEDPVLLDAAQPATEVDRTAIPTAPVPTAIAQGPS